MRSPSGALEGAYAGPPRKPSLNRKGRTRPGRRSPAARIFRMRRALRARSVRRALCRRTSGPMDRMVPARRPEADDVLNYEGGKMKRSLITAFGVAAVLGLAACGEPDDETLEVPDVQETAPPPAVPVTPPDTMMMGDTMMGDTMGIDTMSSM